MMADRLAEIEAHGWTPGAWRTGRKVGRTIYRQHGDEPADTDALIGVMDTVPDAHLAAMAPDLLAVAKAARDYVDASNDPGPVEYAYRLNEAWQALRAALANLEGGATAKTPAPTAVGRNRALGPEGGA